MRISLVITNLDILQLDGMKGNSVGCVCLRPWRVIRAQIETNTEYRWSKNDGVLFFVVPIGPLRIL